MAKGQLRYNISDWRQLSQCLSNLSNEYHIRTRTSTADKLEGTIIEVYHDTLGVVFSYLVDASGDLVDGNGIDMTVSQVLDELSRFGFLVTFNRKDYLSEDQIEYLRTLQGLGFDKLRILYVYEYKNNIKLSTPHVVAFNIEDNPGWLDNCYTASLDEFTKSLTDGSAADLDDVSETKKYRWDWLDYVANIEDILADNTFQITPTKNTYTIEEIDTIVKGLSDRIDVNTDDIDDLQDVAIIEKEGHPCIIKKTDLINGHIIYCPGQTYYESEAGARTQLLSSGGGHIVINWSLFNSGVNESLQQAQFLTFTGTIDKVHVSNDETLTFATVAYKNEMYSKEEIDLKFKDIPVYTLDDIETSWSNRVNIWDYLGFDGTHPVQAILIPNKVEYMTLNDDEYASNGDGLWMLMRTCVYYVYLSYDKKYASYTMLSTSAYSSSFFSSGMASYGYRLNTETNSFERYGDVRFLSSNQALMNDAYTPSDRNHLITKKFFEECSAYEMYVSDSVEHTLAAGERYRVDLDDVNYIIVESAYAKKANFIELSRDGVYDDMSYNEAKSLSYNATDNSYFLDDVTYIDVSEWRCADIFLGRTSLFPHSPLAGRIKFKTLSFTTLKDKVDELQITQDELDSILVIESTTEENTSVEPPTEE